MRSVILIPLGIVAVIAALFVINYPTRPAFLGGPRALPAPTCRDQFVDQSKKGFEFRPCSAPLEHGVDYHFTTGHCGLNWLPDFDGSFWIPKNNEPPFEHVFLDSQDQGLLEVVSEDEAIYRSFEKGTAELTRHEGNLVTKDGCA